MHWLGEAAARAGMKGTAVVVPAAAAAPVAATTTVLVVDDDAMQRLVVSAALEKGGYRVSQASDGAEALRRILDGEECALLVTDLHMTQLDGDALIRSLRADPRTAALPIVVLTGSDQADKETELFELGADDYLRKPIDPTRLLARVRAVLRRSASLCLT